MSEITLQRGFTHNAVAPPGPETFRFIEGAVYLSMPETILSTYVVTLIIESDNYSGF